MTELADNSVDLVVTSPPYPMIEMWDEIFGEQNSAITTALNANNPKLAFELMHQELDKVWNECWRVMKEGAFLCINIGDATRTINGEFTLYNNNTRIISACVKIGFTSLPYILWRKATNAPNKFMGSGMLPCGAYVTLEHEWILIFRKGSKRVFKTASEKKERRESSFFWEERNVWFSDVWELNGVKQKIEKSPTRERNASFPLELPFRLINMFSLRGDVVLDPFVGLGTTIIAAILCERISVGYEIDHLIKPLLKKFFETLSVAKVNSFIYDRYKKHMEFVDDRIKMKREVKHYNDHLECRVVTGQETDIYFHFLENINVIEETNNIEVVSSYLIDRHF
ncbi:MAG: site-specific DNA-methyltransferase [Muribaculaceae bacterium]|nr:site-specific DNA-methyltransferase [Muribaculaceae bacterium]